MKSNLDRNMKMRKAVLGLRKHMADGGDIISRGNQRMDDAIEAMSNGQPAPSMQQSAEQHPAPAPQPVFPTDATPALDKILQAGISLGLRSGGPVRGPGGPTDDKVPAMLSHGEYVLPADTVQAVGKKNLDTLRDRTHSFVGPRPGMANGGVQPYTGSLHDQFDQALNGNTYGLERPTPVDPLAPHIPGTQYKPREFGAVTPYQGDIRSQFDQALGVSHQGLSAQGHSAIANAAPAAEIDTAGIEDPVARAAQAQPIFYQGLRDAMHMGSLTPPPNGGQISPLAPQTLQPLTPPPNGGALPGMADGGMPRKPSMFGGQPFANGGLALYDEARMEDTNAWTGSPGLRFLANGGGAEDAMIRMYGNRVRHYVDGSPGGVKPGSTVGGPQTQFPNGDGIQVGEEIPTQVYPNSTPGASTQSPFQQTLDDTIGQRAQAAKAARMGSAPAAEAAAPAAEAAAGTAEAAPATGGFFNSAGRVFSGLRGKIPTVGGVAKGAAGWLGRAGPLLDAGYAAYGGYQGATEGEQAQAADLGQSQVPTLNSAKGMNAVDATLAHGGSSLLMGALSPQDILWGAGDRSMSVPRDQQGWGARTLNDLTGANDRPDFNNVVGTNGASPNSLRKIGTPNAAAAPAAVPANLPPGSYPGGTQDPRNVDQTAVGPPSYAAGPGATDFAGKPLGYGAQTGNLRTFSDGTGNVPATMGPQDFANLAKGGRLTTMSADAFTHPGSGLGPNTPELGSTGVSSQGPTGGVFHMPRRDPMDSINDHFDALEKQIGPIGNSAARLRSLQGLESERGSLGAGIYGTQTQGDIARNEAQMRAQEFGRQLNNDQFEHNFQGSELGLRNRNFERELAMNQRGYQIQAEHYANDRDEVGRQQLMQGFIGRPGYTLNDKTNTLDAASTQKAQARMNMIERGLAESGMRPGQLNGSQRQQVTDLAEATGNANDIYKGVVGFGRSLINNSPRVESDDISGGIPVQGTRNNGVLGDTVQTGSGETVPTRMYTETNGLGSPTSLRGAKLLKDTGNMNPQNRANGGMIRRGGLRARKNG